MIISKPFKSTTEQIDILKSRGLLFSDITNAELYLFKNNYYNVVNCYSRFLEKSPNHFVNNANFDEIIAIHTFDSEIKNILLKYTITIEHYFKSILAYAYSKETNNQSFPYLNQNNYDFSYIRESSSLIADLNKLIQIENNKKHAAINHYLHIHKNIPLWVLVNFMTFGQSIKLFNYSNKSINHAITRSLNTLINYENNNNLRLSQKDFSIILDSIKNLRNILAHDNKLFDFKSRFSLPYINEIHYKYNIDKNYPRNDVYNILIIMQLFLNKTEFTTMTSSIQTSIIKLQQQLTSISMNKIFASLGFPPDWNIFNISQS